MVKCPIITEGMLASIQDGLSSPDVGTRYAAVDALSVFGKRDKKIMPLLEKTLADADVGLRARAVILLGGMREDGVFQLLEKALSDKEISIRMAACSSLGDLGNKMALPLLEGALNDPDKNVRGFASCAIEKLKR